MSRWRIEFLSEYRETPVSFWVHRHSDHDVWAEATEYDPPLPKPIPAQGYPRLIVDAFGTELHFASIEEARHVREVLAQKHLPTTIRLSSLRQSGRGPNSHWLSRLPGHLKPWRKREKLVSLLDAGIAALERVYG